MSLCIRAIPSKLSSFVGTRSQVMQLDCRLTKLISTSTPIHEVNVSRKLIHNDVKLNSFTCRTTTAIDLNYFELRSYSTASKLAEKTDPIRDTNDLSVPSSDRQSPDDEQSSRGPSPDQLRHVHDVLRQDLPLFFTTPLDYRIYHKDLEFVNNLRGVTTKGIHDYIKQILIIRVTGHLTYAFIKFEILKISMHTEDNTIRVRWRIRGLSMWKAFTNFWRFKWSQLAHDMQSVEKWYDGFSTFYVGTDGLVYKHVADKMMPDDEMVEVKAKPDITAKLAA